MSAVNQHQCWRGLRAFNYVLNPPLFIAFVTVRFSFLSGQSYSKFRIVRQSSLKLFPGIFLSILKFFGKSSQVAKSHRNCPGEKTCQAASAEQFVPSNSRRKIKTVLEKFLLCRTCVSLRKSIQ